MIGTMMVMSFLSIAAIHLGDLFILIITDTPVCCASLCSCLRCFFCCRRKYTRLNESGWVFVFSLLHIRLHQNLCKATCKHLHGVPR